MSEPLYSLDILRLAAGTAEFPRLDAPDRTVERRAVICGSRVIVDVTLDREGRITAFGQEVRACALGQASATLLARSVVGRTVADVAQIRDALTRWLAEEDAPQPDWPGIEALARARGYPARHPAIRLPFDALADAGR
jgi:NifU-like protein involved in Fe-S cluster formation